MQVMLRPAKQNDFEDVLRWRNDPSVRHQSFSSEEITHNQHKEWWASRESRREEVKILLVNNIKLGVVRASFNSNNSACEWSFFSRPSCPRGTGAIMEQASLTWLFDEKKLDYCLCKVLANNLSVIKLHQKFGFTITDRLQTTSKKKFVVMTLSIDNWKFFKHANRQIILRAKKLVSNNL